MALFRRQAIDTRIYDDQSATMWGLFVGNWTRSQIEGANNNTLTSTTTPGTSLSFIFSGTQAWLYGGLLNIMDVDGKYISYPGADYRIDGVPAGSQQPVIDPIKNKFVYFQTTELVDRIHRVDINVTTANETNVFILDYFLIVPSLGSGNQSGVEATGPPTATTPVGAIVGGVVGGIASIAILVFALLWYFLRKRRHGGQAYYFEKPTPADILAIEGHVEPFDITASTVVPSSAGFSGLGLQPGYPDSSLSPSFGRTAASPNISQYSQFGPSETALTYDSGNSAQPRVGRAAMFALQSQDMQQSTQYQDTGIRFNENGEQEAGPSRLRNEVPPTYSPD